MSIPESSTELPEIDVLDTPFKKRVAVSAAALVLLGALLALAASRAGEQEERLSARAQADSITAFAGFGEAWTEISQMFNSDAEARSLRQREAVARAASDLTGVPDYATAAKSWAKASRALDDVSVEENDRAHFDAVNLEASERLLEPRVAALRADTERETATAWGAKADRYVLGITLLAVALSLLGLSLTLAQGSRRLIVVPAFAIIALAAFVSLDAAARRPADTPDKAVRALAEGDRLMTLREYDDAISSYTRAIRLRGDYAPAYRGRATAHDLAGSPESASYVFTTVDEKSRLRSIADLDRTLELSPVDDWLSLVNQGANLFHVRRYAESADLTRQALASNNRLPLPWGNLALDQAAVGDAAAARKSVAEMLERVARRPDPLEQRELYSSGHTTLEILAKQEPRRAKLAHELHGALVAAQAAQVSPGANPAGADAAISDMKINANGWYVGASFQRKNLPADSRVTWIGYFRADRDDHWQQRSTLVRTQRLAEPAPGPQVETFVDYGCAGRGEYRLDAWLDGRRLASATTPNEAAEKRYLSSYDAGGHISACRPADWSLQDDVPGLVRITAPEGEYGALTVRSTPLPVEMLGPADSEVIRTALDRAPECHGLGDPSGESAYFIGGMRGHARVYRPAGTQRAVYCWAGLGTDDLLRVVVARYDATKTAGAAMDSLVSRLYFDIRQP